jgi:hypothetical protein
VNGPGTVQPSTQTSITITLTNPYPVPISGTAALSFTPQTGLPADGTIVFSGGGTSQSFTIPANSVAPETFQFQAGSTAGTLNVTVRLSAGGVDVTPTSLQAPITVTLPEVVPGLMDVSFTQNGSLLTVSVVGYSNTVQVTSANFHFTDSNGAPISNPDVSIPVTDIFNTWYTSDTPNGAPEEASYGSAFTYTQTFTIDQGVIISQVSVTLANSVGTSQTGTSP